MLKVQETMANTSDLEIGYHVQEKSNLLRFCIEVWCALPEQNKKVHYLDLEISIDFFNLFTDTLVNAFVSFP